MFSGSSPVRTKRSPGSAPTTPISKCFAVRKRSHRDEHGILPAKTMKMKGIDTDLQTSPSLSASFLDRVPLPFRKQTISLGLGSFNVFSNCLLITFIETIDVSALIVLCQTSREWQKRITKFVLTKNGQNLMVQRCEQSPKGERYTNNDVFHLYGKLLKALTMGQHNSKRIDFLFDVCKPLFDSPLASGLGRIIRTYCHGLPMLFTIRVLNALMKRECRKLDGEISLILEDEVGAHPQIELKVRKTLHDLLVDAAYGTEEGKLEDAFWLSVLLRTRNAISDQAKLLMLLFAPITKVDTPFGVGSSEQIDWRSLCDHVVVSWEDGIDRIRPIADALDTLTHAVKINHSLYHWNKLQIFNLIEETTTFPEPWAFDNFVFLLMFKPTILAPISLSARMTYNFEDEAGQIICTMKSLLFRWNMDMPIFLLPVLMATVAELPLEPTDKKREFIAVILKAQGKLAGELLMSGIPGEHIDFVEELAAFKMMINVLMPAVNGI